MEKYKQFYISKNVCKNFENDSGIKFINTYDHYIETKAYPLIDKYLPIITISETTRKPDYQIPEATVYDPTKGHIINEKKESDHFILQDSRYISNKYSMIPMYLILEKAIENKVPFYKNYDEANPKPPYKFEYELLNDEMHQKYFELMKKSIKR